MKKIFAAIATVLAVQWISVGSAHAQNASSEKRKIAPAVSPGEPRKDWSFRDFGLIPVQANGRIKPLDTFARESVLFITGSRKWSGWEPLDLVLSWISAPGSWEDRQFIQVGNVDVRKQLGLDEKRTRFSPRELFQESHLAQYAQSVSQSGKDGSSNVQVGLPTAKPGERDQELRRVYERLGLFRNLISGDAWPVVPVPPPGAWKTLASAEMKVENDHIRTQFADTVLAYRAADQSQFERMTVLARAAIQGGVTGWDQTMERAMGAEFLYNWLRPFLMAWILYVLGSLLWLGSMATQETASRRLKKLAWLATGTGVGMHVFGIAVRCYIAGRPPVTNMYESVIWVSIGVLFFAGILYRVTRQKVVMAVSCALGMLFLVAADAAPAIMDPAIHPLVPVLRSNYWLTIHVLTITLSYAAFALCLGIGNVTLFQFLKKNEAGSSAKIASLNQLTYRSMQFGVVLLAAGTILGGVWADYSWGRFWGWDPKEVWALTALLGYLAILHARFTGWMGQFGYAAWTVISFLLVVMAWYGVNFILGAGLHSYGFASGGQGWVGLFSLAQLAYVGGIWAFVLRSRKQVRKARELGVQSSVPAGSPSA